MCDFFRHLDLCDLAALLDEDKFSRMYDRLDRPTLQRISFGSTVCEMQLLCVTDDALRFLGKLADAQHVHLSLTLPCPRESLVDAVCRKAQHILSLLPTCDEIVVNDWFMARHMADMAPDKRIVAGRLLCAYEHDPRMDTAADHAREIAKILQTHADRGLKVTEVDSLKPEPLTTDAEMRCHWPAVMLSSTRYCQYAVDGLGASEFLHQYAHCDRQCQRVYSHYSGRMLKFCRSVYVLMPPDTPVPEGVHLVYWPINEYRELFV